MSSTEWVLVVLVILIPAVVATGVTLWTLEQALKRNRKYRQQSAGSNQSEREAQPDGEHPSSDFGG